MLVMDRGVDLYLKTIVISSPWSNYTPKALSISFLG